MKKIEIVLILALIVLCLLPFDIFVPCVILVLIVVIIATIVLHFKYK